MEENPKIRLFPNNLFSSNKKEEKSTRNLFSLNNCNKDPLSKKNLIYIKEYSDKDQKKLKFMDFFVLMSIMNIIKNYMLVKIIII